jgi:hypothetical protein
VPAEKLPYTTDKKAFNPAPPPFRRFIITFATVAHHTHPAKRRMPYASHRTAHVTNRTPKGTQQHTVNFVLFFFALIVERCSLFAAF